MKKLLSLMSITCTLFFSTCSSHELKSPCSGAQLAAAPVTSNFYVPCSTAKPINRLASVERSKNENS